MLLSSSRRRRGDRGASRSQRKGAQQSKAGRSFKVFQVDSNSSHHNKQQLAEQRRRKDNAQVKLVHVTRAAGWASLHLLHTTMHFALAVVPGAQAGALPMRHSCESCHSMPAMLPCGYCADRVFQVSRPSNHRAELRWLCAVAPVSRCSCRPWGSQRLAPEEALPSELHRWPRGSAQVSDTIKWWEALRSLLGDHQQKGSRLFQPAGLHYKAVLQTCGERRWTGCGTTSCIGMTHGP